MLAPRPPPSDRESWPAVVAGAGAAGLLAAIFAGRAGARVLLLETRSHPGAKIRVSGGGRCNLLPSQVFVEDFHTSGSLRALRNVLFSWPIEKARAFFEEELAIPLKTEPAGKVFPRSDDPREVIGALLRECRRAGAAWRGGFRVMEVRRLEGDPTARFELASDSGEVVRCHRLVLATGGLSLPKTGSDGGGLRIAQALGHELSPAYPALVPLFTEEARWRELAGLSARARLRAVRCGKVIDEREGDFLFTHRGFSGPVVLDLSYHLTRPEGVETELRAHWRGTLAGSWGAQLQAAGGKNLLALLGQHLPRRLAEGLISLAGVPAGRRAGELTREERRRLVETLEDCRLPVSGNEGYRTAEVTGGGVCLSDLHLQTLESRLVPGLHFAGEILDATGRLGGYNFLWAWVTGRKAGMGAGEASARTEAKSLPRKNGWLQAKDGEISANGADKL